MGVSSRTPAVHRAMRVVETVAGRPGIAPSEIAAELGLARSSVVDLVATLDAESLLGRDEVDGLRLGDRPATLVDLPLGGSRLLERFGRSCQRVAELEGHTVSVDRPVGAQSVCLDVRMGRLPLRLTPRPGQQTPLAESAGGLAVLRGLTPERAGGRIAQYAGHQGLSDGDIAELLAIRAALSPTGVVGRAGRHGAEQLAAPIRGDADEPVAAVVLHLPAGHRDTSEQRRWSRALLSLAATIGGAGRHG